MRPDSKAPRRFGARFMRLLAMARNPFGVVPLLAFRRLDLAGQFRVGKLFLSARRSDLGPISEIGIEGEYGFVDGLPFPDDGALVLDMGANVGCFAALAFSRCPGAEVHSIEPSPDTFSLLSTNRDRYPSFGWHLHQAAIGLTTGTSRFRNAGPSGSRRLSPGNGQGIDVETEAFDAFVSRVAQSRRVFLCKMDIEGAEVGVFSGPMKTLRQIDHFVIEVHGPAENTALVVEKLSHEFPRVERIPHRGSPKPMIHAWRPAAARSPIAMAAGQ